MSLWIGSFGHAKWVRSMTSLLSKIQFKVNYPERILKFRLLFSHLFTLSSFHLQPNTTTENLLSINYLDEYLGSDLFWEGTFTRSSWPRYAVGCFVWSSFFWIRLRDSAYSSITVLLWKLLLSSFKDCRLFNWGKFWPYHHRFFLYLISFHWVFSFRFEKDNSDH